MHQIRSLRYDRCVSGLDDDVVDHDDVQSSFVDDVG
jgi:hypothetical protein